MKYLCKTIEETVALAQNIAQNLEQGVVIGLIGNLGAGKTTFSQALAKALGVKRNVTSPTFVLMKVYPLKKKLLKHFVHIDAYRLNNTQSILALGADEYWQDGKAVVLVEWADRIKDVLPKKTIYIKIKTVGKGREFTIPKNLV